MNSLRISTLIAGKVLGLKQDTVKKYCQRYALGQKIGKKWYLSHSDLDFIASRKGQIGRSL